MNYSTQELVKCCSSRLLTTQDSVNLPQFTELFSLNWSCLFHSKRAFLHLRQKAMFSHVYASCDLPLCIAFFSHMKTEGGWNSESSRMDKKILCKISTGYSNHALHVSPSKLSDTWNRNGILNKQISLTQNPPFQNLHRYKFSLTCWMAWMPFILAVADLPAKVEVIRTDFDWEL